MGLNKTDWVFLGSAFYGIIFLLLAMVPLSSTIENGDLASDGEFKVNFLLVDNIQELPNWINAIIFGPLVITFSFLIITSIFGFAFDGGS